MKEKLYDFLLALMRPIYGFLFRRKVFGLENVPETGGFVVCANHLHARDPFFVESAMPKGRRLYALAKKELFSFKPLAKFLTALGAIPVDRGNADLSAMRSAFKVLKEGYGLMIFPQGTRSPENARLPFLTGTSMIALRAGVKVIPAFIDGPYRLFGGVRLSFGAPVDFSDLGTRIDSGVLEAATRRIEDAVWSLQKCTEN